MNRRDLRLMGLIALAVAFVAVRVIASAQESADDPSSAGGAASPDAVPSNGPAVVSHPIATAGRIANDDATVLVLAMAMVAEANWDAPEDHAAIAHVLLKRATQRGITLQQQAIEYCSAFRVDTARTRWVLGLRLDAQKPDAWPVRYSWTAHVDRWMTVIDLARRFVADPSSVPNPCPSARHFGGSMDAQKAGTVPARCSVRTANTFYAVAAR